METLDVLVIGAGVVGLACARALALSGREVVVADRHAEQGSETSSRNSEVIHAGIYYAPGSLKARLCVEGREALYRYADEKSVPHRQCGKLIVASGEGGRAGLQKVRERAQAAGAGTLEWLDAAQIAGCEPEVRADLGLFSPRTGIVDSHALMVAYLSDIEAAGGVFARQADVVNLEARSDDFRVTLADGGEVAARAVVNCAGLFSGRVAAMIDALPERFKPTIRYARGVYFRPLRSPGLRHLVYPLPDEASLGVHATIDLAGEVRFGPDVEWIDDPCDYRVDPARAAAFTSSISEYLPSIAGEELVPDYAGIRPKLAGPGEAAADFRIDGPADHGLARLVNLHGIESPGLTASLALGELVARRLFEDACEAGGLC